MGHRDLYLACLQQEPLAAVLAEVRQWPPRRAVSPLIGCLFNSGRVKWHAVSSLGVVVSALAAEDLEAARTVMRRLMWSLNDESGNIGWGAPEALAEIITLHEGLAAEYGPLLVAYLRPGSLFLEHPVLQRGLLWGIGRLAGTKAHLLGHWGVTALLPPYLASRDPKVRGLAAQAAGLLRMGEVRERLTALTAESTPFLLYREGQRVPVTVGHLAREALARLTPPREPGREVRHPECPLPRSHPQE